MATTPRGIWYPSNAELIAPLESLFSGMASSINDNMGVTKLFDNSSGMAVATTTSTTPVAVVSTGTLTLAPGVRQILVNCSWWAVGVSPATGGIRVYMSGSGPTPLIQQEQITTTGSTGRVAGSRSYVFQASGSISLQMLCFKEGGTAGTISLSEGLLQVLDLGVAA